jgi:hypothetical protein
MPGNYNRVAQEEYPFGREDETRPVNVCAFCKSAVNAFVGHVCPGKQEFESYGSKSCVQAPHKCYCSRDALMRDGCKCGGK